MKKKEKRFVVRKYVMATSAAAAIQKERKQPVDEVYLDDAKPAPPHQKEPVMGFVMDTEEDQWCDECDE